MISIEMKKEELAKYLAGYPAYRLENPSASTPTDPILVMKPIRSAIVSDSDFREEFMKALLELADDPEYGWMVMYYISNLATLEKTSGHKLITDQFLDEVRSSLYCNQNQLAKRFDWQGYLWNEGLWGEVLHLNQVMSEFDGFQVLPNAVHPTPKGKK